jgi:hypothetical protein
MYYADSILVIDEVPDWEQHMFAGQIVTYLPRVSKGVGGEGNLFWPPLNRDEV